MKSRKISLALVLSLLLTSVCAMAIISEAAEPVKIDLDANDVFTSYVFWADDNPLPLLVDGIISYGNDPRNRWSSYEGGETVYAGAGFDLAEINMIKLYVFSDGGGVKPPASISVDYYSGSNWVKDSYSDDNQWTAVNLLSAEPTVPAEGLNVIKFETVETTAIRIKFVRNGGWPTGVGLTEMEFYGEPAEQTLEDGIDVKLLDENDEVTESLDDTKSIDISITSTDSIAGTAICASYVLVNNLPVLVDVFTQPVLPTDYIDNVAKVNVDSLSISDGGFVKVMFWDSITSNITPIFESMLINGAI